MPSTKKGKSMKIINAPFYSSLFCLSFSYFSFSTVLASNECVTDPVEKIFTHIYKENIWESQESISGPGSELRVTQRMRRELSALIKRFGIASIADAPCGDLNWMKHVDIGKCRYIGIDIVKELIESNTRIFGDTREFRHLNLVENIIDQVDLIICRDMLAHLTYEQIFTVLKNFKQSGSKYLLVTTGITTQKNYDMPNTGECRFLNLELPPFNFPRPLALIEEDVPFALERGKHLALWFLEDINV
jgi:hypothetical protein